MALQTDLSRSPYYDDYSADKNFYRVLYRPGTAVQTRELNQMQTILQDQIDKFGRHIFTEGSVVEGCSFTYDNAYDYVKISDTYANGYSFTISDFQDKYVYNENGLKAIIVNTVVGYSSQDPDLNTLYLKYLNVGTFPNSSPQNLFVNNEIITVSANLETSNTTAIIGDVTVATVANSTGQGFAFSTTSGTIFQKGFFVNVKPQTIIVSKYKNAPTDVSIGFDSVETITTPESDTSLLDNAAGAPNYAAPGAHRLQLVPTLITVTTSELESNTEFFSLVDFTDGVPTSIKNDPEYNILGKQIARRTYETNGNYIVSPFLLSTEPKASTDAKYPNYVNLITSRGLGYVEGYRVEFVNNVKVPLRKGLDTEKILNQTVSANYGNYIYVKEYTGDFDTENLAEVELHNGTAKTSITSRTYLGTSRNTANIIGTARVKAVVYDSGTIGSSDAVYRVYLYDVNMGNGYNFSDIRSVLRYDSTVKAVGDVVLTYNATLQKDIAVLEEPALNTLVFPLGQQAVKSNGVTNIQFVYRNKASAQILTNGSMTVNLPDIVTGTGTESFLYSGPLNKQEIQSFVVIPTANVNTNYYGGTANVASGSKIVTGGTSTVFDTAFKAGDFIKINGEIHIVNSVTNNSSLSVRTNFASTATGQFYYKAFMAGVPIDFSQTGRSVSITGGTATFNLGETLASSLQTTVYHDIQRSNSVSIAKNITKNAIVKIDCSTHVNGADGPWSLGLPDVSKINAIYISADGAYGNSTTSTDSSGIFNFRNGQTDNMYRLGSVALKNNALNTVKTNSTLLIDLDVFSQNRSQGVSFFTANSYPIDDVNSANTTAIKTQEIPKYTATSSFVYDLRDSVDFRPYFANSAVITTSYASATVNPGVSSGVSLLASGSYIPSINTNWEADVEHYLPRKDIVVIDTKGKVKVIEGIPDPQPLPPKNISGAMTLGIVNIPPYPSLTPKEAKLVNRYDYSISTSITQNRRYTMADIGTLSRRIDNLEYYTSLNSLEVNTNAMLVKNDTTGLNRFKNGILVDPFAGHDIGDTLDPNYNIAIDSRNKELRPKFNQRIESFDLDLELSSGVVRKGPIILLDYDEVSYISQNYASKYRNCVEGNIYVWKTIVKLTPNYHSSPSLTKGPDVVGNLDMSANWINLQKAWGTQWGNWETVDSKTNVSVGDKTETGRTTDAAGNVTKTFNQRTTTTTSTKQTKTGTVLDITGYNENSIKLGEYVTDVSVLPYIQSKTIKYEAHGLKPGARIYAYFNNINVTDWCIPGVIFGLGAIPPNPYDVSVNTSYDSPLYVNWNGSIYGHFTIPPDTFQATELTFMLCDASNLATGSSAITTQAVGLYYGNKLSIAKGTATLNTREPILAYHEVTAEQTLTNTTNLDDITNTFEPGPVIEKSNPTNHNGDSSPNLGGPSGDGDGWDDDDDDDDCECDAEDDDDDDDDDDGDDDDGDDGDGDDGDGDGDGGE